MINIYHNLGLGDHIVCNGIIRHYAELYNRVNIYCKPHNEHSVKAMYADDANIKVIALPQKDIESIPKYDNWVIARSKADGEYSFDEEMYIKARVPFDHKWTKFQIPRNIDREKELSNKLGIKGNKDFIFIHDKESMPIHITTDIATVCPDNLDYAITDYLYILENAKEIHCIDSAFLNLVDCYGIDSDLYFHKSVRGATEMATPKLKLNWKVI